MFRIGGKTKIWVWAAGGVIFLLLFVNMVFGPLVQKVMRLQQKIRSSELQVKEGLRVQQRKDEIKEEYAELAPYLETRENYSDQEMMGDFLKELEEIAQNANVSVVGLSPMEPGEREKHKIFNADFKGEGSIKDILTFFDKIQKSRKLINTEKFNIVPKDKDGLIMKLDAQISMAMQ